MQYPSGTFTNTVLVGISLICNMLYLFLSLSYQKRKFSTIKELFHSQGTFPQSRNFSAIVETFHSQGTFSQSWKFPHIKFTWLRKFSTNNRIFYSKGNFPEKSLLDQRSFLQTRKFFTSNYFYTIRKVSANKDKKGFSES